MQRILAIARLTWKAAFRFRLFWVIAGLLLLAVVVLPLVLRHDGTAAGFTQILLTYTLSLITLLLGFATLWLACGTLARDIEECQIQMVAVKPVARWEIWLGKWLGISFMNAVLLALAGASVFVVLQWRVHQLPPQVQEVLRNEIFVARGSMREAQRDIDGLTQQAFQAFTKEKPVAPAEELFVRSQIRETIKAQDQLVPPGHMRQWKIDLGIKRFALQDELMSIRFRFHAAQTNEAGEYLGVWRVGPSAEQQAYSPRLKWAANSFHEVYLPTNSWDATGRVTIVFENRSDSALLFPLEDGLELLYREGSFGWNYVRGLTVIFCWLGLLAALGLAAASLMSFPVAAFFAGSLLVVVMSSGTLSTVVQEGSILGGDHEGNRAAQTWIDIALLPVFRGLLGVVNLVQAFSPVDALSSGRSIPLEQLGLAFAEIVLLMGGICAGFGIFFFSRRELATVQAQS